jgi:hypothetical protein
LKLLEATVGSLINSNSSLREENAKLNAEISVLESNLNNLQADLSAYDDIISNLNLTIEDLRGQVTTLTNDKNKLQADLNSHIRFKDISFGSSEASYNSGKVLFNIGIDGKGYYGGEFIGSDGMRGNIDGVYNGQYCYTS